MKTEIPEIGQTISVEYGLKLAETFLGIDHYVTLRINKNKNNLKPFIFDGCSGIDDLQMEKWKILHLPWDKILVCCLKHDLKYWVGIIANEYKERLTADLELHQDLLDINIPREIAILFYMAVRQFGPAYLKIDGVSWGFGWK